jgi:hypothetical protein
MSNKIEELNSQIKDLRSEKIFLSTHLSVLMENYYQNRSSENIVKMDELRKEINEIDSNLNPLLIQFENLHHHYFVIFSSEMPDTLGQAKSKYTFQSNMHSSIDCNIDTLKNGFDLRIPNLRELVEDLGQRLMHSYTNVRFDRIAKIK